VDPERESNDMNRRRLVFVSSLVLAAAVLSPVTALGAATGTGHPVRLRGTSKETAIIDLATGTGTSDGTFRLTHLGKGTEHTDFTSFTLTGNTFASMGTATFIAANGDQVFTTTVGSGVVTSTGSESTTLDTITGGTGRFAHAHGHFKVTTAGVTVSIVGSIVTSTSTSTERGRIRY
jgi:hypothetical protein